MNLSVLIHSLFTDTMFLWLLGVGLLAALRLIYLFINH